MVVSVALNIAIAKVVSFLSLVLVVGHASALTLGLHINIIHCEPISILVCTVQQFSEVSWAIKDHVRIPPFLRSFSKVLSMPIKGQ
jgi:hypothetical protein